MALDRDAYFTPLENCKTFVKEIIEKIPNALEYTWVEPSAGSGNFLEAAKNAGVKNYEAYDIHPFHPEVKKIDDFLTEDIDLTGKLVFGNPPYGTRNKLTVAFVNRAFELGAEYVAFYLLASASYVSYRKRMPNAKMISFNRVGSVFVDESGTTVRKYSDKLAFIIFKKSDNPLSFKTKVRTEASTISDASFYIGAGYFNFNLDTSKFNPYSSKVFMHRHHAILEDGSLVKCYKTSADTIELIKKHEKELLEIGNRSVTNRPSAGEINWFLHCKYDQLDPALL